MRIFPKYTNMEQIIYPQFSKKGFKNLMSNFFEIDFAIKLIVHGPGPWKEPFGTKTRDKF